MLVERRRTGNENVRPERDAGSGWPSSESKNDDLLDAGFALQLIAPRRGILKGTSSIVTTSGRLPSSIVATHVAQHLRLTSPPGGDRRHYPNSPMGAVALARQTFYDAVWYADAWSAYRQRKGVPRPETNLALATLAEAIEEDALFVFDAPDEQYALRANRFAVEFGLNRMVLRGSGREYQRLDAVADTQRPIIVPVNFPKPPNVATPEAANDAALSELMHWHLAPENPSRLNEAGVTIALTTHGLEKKADFRNRVRRAVERGWNADDALKACTIAPARLLGIDAQVGSIAVGKAAHFMITDGDWLDKDTKVIETWVDGKRFEHHASTHHGLAGRWKLSFGIDWRPQRPSSHFVSDADRTRRQHEWNDHKPTVPCCGRARERERRRDQARSPSS